ncbi:MAG: hypothetical protein LUE27_10005 [Clostridia bacterium]|nr:hypothetical protein [Clostridia bacterium]
MSKFEVVEEARSLITVNAVEPLNVYIEWYNGQYVECLCGYHMIVDDIIASRGTQKYGTEDIISVICAVKEKFKTRMEVLSSTKELVIRSIISVTTDRVMRGPKFPTYESYAESDTESIQYPFSSTLAENKRMIEGFFDVILNENLLEAADAAAK